MKVFLVILLSFNIATIVAQDFSDPHLWENAIIENLDAVNTDKEEFSPFLWNETLTYLSRQERGNIFNRKDTNFYDIKSINITAGTTAQPRSFSRELNSKYHEGPMCILNDKIYFTRANQNEDDIIVDKYARLLLQLYEAKYEKGRWRNIKKVNINDNEANYCHPTLSSDEKLMLFSSSNENGFGKMDLYFSKRNESGSWKRPINLGEEINNAGNQWFPFLYGDNDLFFASDIGDGNGMDVYYCQIDTFGTIEKISRLPYPINTIKDDFGIFINKDGQSGYLSSNRDGGMGKDDIYYFKFDLLKESIHNNNSNKKQIKISTTSVNDNTNIDYVTVNVYKLNSSSAASFLHQLTENVDFNLIEAMAAQAGELESHVTDKNGELILSLDDNSQYFITVKKDGKASDWNYIYTRQNINNVIFEMSNN